MKRMYVDIGELGWSLCLSAHLRWRKKHTDECIGIMTYASRHCLYNGIADIIFDVPNDFYKKFNRKKEACFGLKGTSPKELSGYFAEKIPFGYEFGGFFGYKIRWAGTIFKPYSYSKELNGKKEILIFPRFRSAERFRTRNLPEHFYVKLISVLCDKFPDYIIRAIGIPYGAYNINGIKSTNYINDVREGADLQDLIDRCQVAVAAVGSQSGPPKITLLQGVPTFMIGHQKERHMNRDNWMSTKTEFYEILKRHYATMDIEDCINKIIAFTEECHHA